MIHHKNSYNVFDANVGDTLEPLNVLVTEDAVERKAWANDDYNPWYMEDSPFGGRIASPTFLVLQCPKMFWDRFPHPPGGGLHTAHEFEFINPIKVGGRIRITGKLAERYSKRGREYFITDFLAVDQDGTELVRMRMTMAAPVVAKPNSITE